ncbi:MAG: hypothetical protein IRY91_14130, partial [Gemmatimonadaceae bacterium]|nr:hypothetical protein [Gemmatimonadaceae bacterium]
RPPPKHAVATLFPRGGVPFDEPRFLPDGRQLLLVRYTGDADGRIRPDLYLWNFHTGALRRVTHGASIRHADPSPDGRSAVGDRCLEGICDVVRVDLATGHVERLAAGTPQRVFDRPRYSPDGATIAVSVEEHGRWRVALLDARAPSGDSLRYVDPDDGVSRYDAAFLPDGRALVVVSEQGGVQNLARLDLATHTVQPLTLVTSAALAPAPDPATGDIYFLHLHPKGLDLNVIPDSVVRAPSPALAASLAPAARIPVEPAPAFAAESLPAPRAYGAGPRRSMLLPGASIGAEGKSFGVMLAGTDPVGRLTWVAQGFFGDRGTWRGGALGAAWRGTRPAIGGALFYAEDLPSQQHGGVAAPRALDAYYAAAELHVQLDDDRLTNAHVLRAGGSVGRLSGAAYGRDTRALGFIEYRGAIEQSPGEWTVVERVGVHGSAGRTAGTDWARTIAGASVTVRTRSFALSGDGAYGIVSRNGSAFEQFTLGGTGAPFFDSALLTQRVVMPALPVAVAGGRQFAAYRVALPRRGLVPYFWSGSAGESLRDWHHVVGLEATFQAHGLWAVRLPDVRVVGGVGYSLSRPVRHETRGYLSLTYRP